MDAKPATVKDVIASLGGTAVVAAKAGVERNTVVWWQSRGRIPVEHWPVLISMGADNAVLHKTSRPRKPRSDTHSSQVA